MNQKQKAIQRNNIARLVRHSNRSGSHRNCIRIAKSSSWAHEYMKVKLAWNLIREGHEILTEAIFLNNCRADVLDLDTGTVYEVTHSEDGTSLKKKAARYPEGLTIVSVCSLTAEQTIVRS